MLAFFRSSQSFVGLPLLAYAVVLQLPYLMRPPVAEVGPAGIFGGYVITWSQTHPMLAQVGLVFLLAIQGIQVNVLATRHGLARQVTQFPGVLAITALCLVPPLRALHPAHLANVGLLFALLALGRTYQRDQPAVLHFNVGAWLAWAALFVPAYLGFLVPLWIGVGVLGRLTVLTVLRTLVGVFVVGFLLFTVGYVFGDVAAIRAAQTGNISFYLLPFSGVAAWVCLVTAAALLTAVPLSEMARPGILNMEGQKGVQVLFWALLATPFLLPFWGGIGLAGLAPAVLLTGALFGLRLPEWRVRSANFVHLLLVVATLLVAFL